MHILDKVIITKYNTCELLYKKETHKVFDNRLKLNAYRLRLYRFAKYLHNAEVTVTFSIRTVEKSIPTDLIAEDIKKTTDKRIRALNNKGEEIYYQFNGKDFEKAEL